MSTSAWFYTSVRFVASKGEVKLSVYSWYVLPIPELFALSLSDKRFKWLVDVAQDATEGFIGQCDCPHVIDREERRLLGTSLAMT